MKKGNFLVLIFILTTLAPSFGQTDSSSQAKTPKTPAENKTTENDSTEKKADSSSTSFNAIAGGNLKIGEQQFFEAFYGEVSVDLEFKSFFSKSLTKKMNIYGGFFGANLWYGSPTDLRGAARYLSSSAISKPVSPNNTFVIREQFNIESRNELRNISGFAFIGQNLIDEENQFQIAFGPYFDISFSRMRRTANFKSTQLDSGLATVADSVFFQTRGSLKSRSNWLSGTDTTKYTNAGVSYGIAAKATFENEKLKVLYFAGTGFTSIRNGDYYPDGGGISRLINTSLTGKSQKMNYLIRFQLSEKASKLGLTIGTEARGLYGPGTRPLIMFYAASRITL